MPYRHISPFLKGRDVMNAVEIMQQLLANAEFIDMTRIMEEGMPYWPTQPAFEAETIESQELGNESYFRKIVMCEHTGTHIDAGCHFVPGKQSVDEIPVTQIIGRALNIDATDTPACGVADVNVIKRFEEQFGSVQNGAIDLSQKYILTLTAYVSCTVMAKNVLLGLVAAIIVGALCGFISSCVNVFLKVPAMITTLATGYLFYTVILVVSSKWSSIPAKGFVKFVNKNLIGINMMTIVCIVVAVILWFLLYRTKYGHQLHAVGQKREAARLAGIHVGKTVIIAFVINGALCGLAGAMAAAYCGGANQDLGTTYFLPSVAAAFVGGTNAAGGKSSVVGVSIGALMMTLMSTFLNAAKLDVGVQRLIQGVFLVFLLVVAVSDASKKK